MKKLLSLILVLCMLASMSITAFATDGDSTPATSFEATLAGSAETTSVDTIQAALNEVRATGGEITVVAPDSSTDPIVTGGGEITSKGDVGNTNEKITIDLNGNNLSIESSVGSTGTVSQGLHLEDSVDEVIITDKATLAEEENKEITFPGTQENNLQFGIQNYTDLVLDNVTIDGTGLYEGTNYVVSNNSGSLTVQNTASIIAREGDVAFDVYLYVNGGYTDAPNVTIEEDAGTIQGTIEFDAGGTKEAIEDVIECEEEPLLSIEGGNFTNFLLRIGNAVAEYAEKCISISGGTFDKVENVVVNSNNEVSDYQLSDFLEEGMEFHYVEEDGKAYYVVRVKPTPSEPPVEVYIPVEPEYVPAPAPAPKPAAPAPVVVAPTAPVAVEVNGATVELTVVAEDIKAEAVAPVKEGKAAELKVTVAPTVLAVEGAEAEEVVEALVATATVSVKEGETLAAENYQITMDANGELKVELSAEYLKTLGEGEHIIVLNIGGIEIEFTIIIK